MAKTHRLWLLQLQENSRYYNFVDEVCTSLSYCIFAYIFKKDKLGRPVCNIMIKFENARTLSSIKKTFSEDVLIIENSGKIIEFLSNEYNKYDYTRVITNNKAELPYLLGILKRNPKATVKRIYDFNKTHKIISFGLLFEEYGPSVYDEPYFSIINDLIAENKKLV